MPVKRLSHVADLLEEMPGKMQYSQDYDDYNYYQTADPEKATPEQTAHHCPHFERGLKA